MSLVIALGIWMFITLILASITSWLFDHGHHTAAKWVNFISACFSFSQFVYYFGVLITVLLVVGAAALGCVVGYRRAKYMTRTYSEG